MKPMTPEPPNSQSAPAMTSAEYPSYPSKNARPLTATHAFMLAVPSFEPSVDMKRFDCVTVGSLDEPPLIRSRMFLSSVKRSGRFWCAVLTSARSKAAALMGGVARTQVMVTSFRSVKIGPDSVRPNAAMPPVGTVTVSLIGVLEDGKVGENAPDPNPKPVLVSANAQIGIPTGSVEVTELADSVITSPAASGFPVSSSETRTGTRDDDKPLISAQPTDCDVGCANAGAEKPIMAELTKAALKSLSAIFSLDVLFGTFGLSATTRDGVKIKSLPDRPMASLDACGSCCNGFERRQDVGPVRPASTTSGVISEAGVMRRDAVAVGGTDGAMLACRPEVHLVPAPSACAEETAGQHSAPRAREQVRNGHH